MKKKNHRVFMRTAIIFADESKCVSKHVGAVVVKDGRIISTGINGAPHDLPNCCDVFDPENFDREKHHVWSKDNEIHAEMNATGFSAKHNVEMDGCDMYVTISPCNECLKNLTATGIKNIYYLYKYDRATLNPTILKKINVLEVPGAAELREFAELIGVKQIK